MYFLQIFFIEKEKRYQKNFFHKFQSTNNNFFLRKNMKNGICKLHQNVQRVHVQLTGNPGSLDSSSKTNKLVIKILNLWNHEPYFI